MNAWIEFAVASPEFYAPLETASDGREPFAPDCVPEGWSAVLSGVWTMWHRPGAPPIPGEGWKVHVSARPDRLRQVLDTVAGVCFEQDVPFKHIASDLFYFWTHQKYASRVQGGKFIAMYPADADAARRLMERLRAELSEEEGPYVLTDRRFKDSRTVHYRYGAFAPTSRLQADGTLTMVVRDGRGETVADRREASFHLPDGVEDRFVEHVPVPAPARGAGPATGFDRFSFVSAVRFTNAGGTYRGLERATGRKVFIKEGRSHIGLREDGATATVQLREEWDVLTALHELVPGVAPEPLAYFPAWEHEFMVTEHVEGILLGRWLAANHPMIIAGSAAGDFTAYYERCEQILAAVESALARLHEAGYLFVDVSPSNVVVAPDGSVRLVDFGAAHRLGGTFLRVGTPGYSPPVSLVDDDLALYDDFGLSALALLMLAPLNIMANLHPGVLAHLRHDLAAQPVAVPPALWNRAVRHYRIVGESDDGESDGGESDGGAAEPAPEQVAADPLRYLADLRDRVADALVAMAEVDDPRRVFPTIPQGYLSNTSCVAYGTAGVIHALNRAERTLPDGVLDRLRSDALVDPDTLPPGLYVGSAGIARVLADCGRLDEAGDLLAAADRHRLTRESATLFGGSAGVALSHLALYGHTRDERHVDRALELAAALPADADLTGHLGADDATGLLHGRSGIALMLQQLAGVTGDGDHLDRAIRLLHTELDRASDPGAPGLLFPVSATDSRAMPYLGRGTAGVVHAVTRCLLAADDERLAEALPGLLAPLRLTCTAMPGLFQGLAGYCLTLADQALLTGAEQCRLDALHTSRSLYKSAIPHPTGVRFLGDQLLRYSAELWSGSAGVLLALTHVLDPQADVLFTVDSLISERVPAGASSGAGPVRFGAVRTR